MFTSPFKVEEAVKLVFVQDFLIQDLIGGAELSMYALHESAPIPFLIVRSHQLTEAIVAQNKHCHWVFGNFSNLHPTAIEYFISSGISYSVFEHDYKFCKWRSIEKHETEGKEKCNCEKEQIGKLIERFFLKAKQVWFCSNKHMQVYLNRFPALRLANCEVLSATFDENFFRKIVPLMESLPNRKKSGWLTLDSDSWIKGTDDAIKWLKDNGKSYKLIKNMSPDQVLEAMANAEGFITLPRGADVSNRMVTEATLLGCEVVTNDKVQHADEDWLVDKNKQNTLAWLYNRRKVFWDRTLTFIK
jgi:hypothetical protein